MMTARGPGRARGALMAATGLATAAALTLSAEARDTIRIVGSSTVFPFAQAAAEQFGARADAPTPVVEQTGTGGGIQQFCAGVGEEFPDIATASRRLKWNEWRVCQDNGVTDIIEVQIGYDGIVFANTKEDPRAPVFALQREHVFTALAAKVPTSDADCTLRDNPYQTWAEIDPDLPDVEIEVFGPPPTSGTRDAFVEVAMESGAKTYTCLREMAQTDPDGFRRIAHILREDGYWIDAGENDNALVNLLLKSPLALGVFGFSFLDQNSDRMRGATFDGAAPTFENIASGEYPVSRSLFFYIKRAHVDLVPGLGEFAQEFVSDAAGGPFGYLVDRGLIPLPDADRSAMAARVASLSVMTGEELSDRPAGQLSSTLRPTE